MPVVVDRRPLHVLLMQQGFPFAALTVIGLVAFWALQLDAPDGLSLAGWRAIVVFVLCLVLWVTQLLPLSVTSLLGLALLPIFDVLPANDVYGMFGNPAVFFILGSFILAAGVIKTGLSEYIALVFLDRVGLGPKRLLLAMLLLPAFMAAFMPEHAVAAVFLPIAWEIVRGLDLKLGHRYAQAIFLALAWGAIIGGVATLLGGARGPLALGLLIELTGSQFSFLDWVLAAFPLVLLMLVIAATVLLVTTPFDNLDIQLARTRIEDRQLVLGDLSLQGRMMALLLFTTVLAWITVGHHLGLASIALISVVAMFCLRLASWKDVEKQVNWGIILMYGGAIAVGKALAVTGAGAWLAAEVLPQGLVPLALLALLAVVTLLMTEGVSNAAAVAILLPVAIPLGAASGMDPVIIALAIGIVAGFAFMLPMGTPANALIFSTGYVEISALLKKGAILSLSAFSLFVLCAWLWWPWLSLGR